MTLDELVAEVITLTKRPDLVDLSKSMVLEATNTVHNVQDWWKDIDTVLVNFSDPNQYIQIIDTQSLPRFKTVAFLRKTNNQAGPVQQYGQPWPPANNGYPPVNFNVLQRVEIDDIIDSYGYEKTDIWYAAGSQINVKSSTGLAQVLCAFYQSPMLGRTNDRYKSWIAIDLPWVIIYRAAGHVFAHIGMDTQFALYMKPPMPGRDLDTGGLYWQQLDILQQSNLIAGN